MMERSFSRQLAEYAVSLYQEGPSAQVRDCALGFLSDTFAVMLAGSKEPASKLASDYAIRYAKLGGATLVATGFQKVDAYFAAMANGVAAHIHDYDDVCTTMIGHPSVAILPAVLAVAQENGCSGEQVLRSYTVGVEVCALMGRLTCPELNRRGWHSTEVIGVLGSAAAVGCLLGLDAPHLQNAIGIAASESGGLKVNYGTMTKSLHAGRAAAKGILAARLAKDGFTASSCVLEGECGYLTAFAGTWHQDAFLNALQCRNSEFLDPGLTMKPWPCCKGMHNAIWAMMELMQECHWNADEIERIDCRVLPFTKDILIYEIAETPLQGKFSMNYAIAKVVLQQRLNMRDFEGPAVTDPTLIRMMQKVHMVLDESLVPGGGYYDPSECARVEVFLANGTMRSKFCAAAKGTPANPMTLEERRNKMYDCMSRTVKKETIPELISLVERIHTLSDINLLFDVLQSGLLA